MMKLIILSVQIFISFFCFAQNKRIPVYKDPSQPIESRVKDLLKRMTLQEKIAQMQDISFSEISNENKMDAEKLNKHLKGLSYGCFEGMNTSVEEYAVAIDQIQKYLLQKSRLGIPMLSTSEALHGCVHAGATIFPQAIALGSTFNPPMIHQMTRTITKE
jgi:beta-glucosidase